jgi:hypothetical protein
MILPMVFVSWMLVLVSTLVIDVVELLDVVVDDDRDI